MGRVRASEEGACSLSEPDYQSYSTAELHDALDHIDGDRFPERRARLLAELERRQEQPDAAPAASAEPLKPRHLGLSRRALAIYLMATGGMSLAWALDHLEWASTSATVLALGAALVLATYGGMALAGIAVWRRAPHGMLVGAASTVLQIPFLQVGRVAYTVSAMPSLELKLYPFLGFQAGLGGAFSMFLHDADQPLYLGVNLMAITYTWALVYHGQKLLVARRRLRARRTLS